MERKPRRKTTPGAGLRRIGRLNEKLSGHVGESGSRVHRGSGLRAELVLLNFHGGQTIVKADDTATGYQLEGTLVVQLGGPTDGQFDAPARPQDLHRGKKHA